MWRPAARVSVFDSGFLLGDGVWEGLRLHGGVVLFAEQHFRRLWEGAKALDMDLGGWPGVLGGGMGRGLGQRQLHVCFVNTPSHALGAIETEAHALGAIETEAHAGAHPEPKAGTYGPPTSIKEKHQ